MTGKPTDREIDQLLRTRWLEIGLAQADLAELLDAALQPTSNDRNQPAAMDSGRLTQLVKGLGIPGALPGPDETGQIASWPPRHPGSQQSMLQLRLLRAFCELRDHRAQRMLVYLAEQLAKSAATRPGDGS